jgi:hypothetical protein
MPQGAQQFTPQQLLQAGRRAEADGRADLAYRFYWHLVDQYGYTPEAVDARNGLVRVGAVGQAPQSGHHVTNPSGAKVPALAPGEAWSSTARRPRAGPALPVEYRSGRALAVLASGVGWTLIVGAAVAAGVGAAAYVAPVAVLRDFKLTYGLLLYVGGALPSGAALVLVGQAARALFDQANATRELAAMARTRSKRNEDG